MGNTVLNLTTSRSRSLEGGAVPVADLVTVASQEITTSTSNTVSTIVVPVLATGESMVLEVISTVDVWVKGNTGTGAADPDATVAGGRFRVTAGIPRQFGVVPGQKFAVCDVA